ncbi:CBO0543 family protein [Neobacillus sp. PS3-12]|uniref:CBO0543 family protein n=1 Tax=Neobacillus sp. PS3-12 TaxID=3070677 RepID=UPI0027DFD4F1|nr:CBO0543 family protein [Neobacillus sp. PS3-12]WML53267.1 CBO0543 family protein [Neobacillus sp. PS3-12]
MEKKLLNLVLAMSMVSLPFLFRGSKMRENLVIFFSKGVLATLVDAYVVGRKKMAYPVRPFPKIFKTNILYDMLFFPVLSVIWVRMSYNDSLGKILLKSLIFSVPMSIGQWYFERNSRLFKWKKWTPLHTFGSVSFTLFIIRGFVGLIKKLDKLKGNQNITEL